MRHSDADHLRTEMCTNEIESVSTESTLSWAVKDVASKVKKMKTHTEKERELERKVKPAK